jgi:hypothetical protein
MHILSILYFNFNSMTLINYNIALYKKINDTFCLKKFSKTVTLYAFNQALVILSRHKDTHTLLH